MKILIFILSLFIISEIQGATYNATVLKNMGTNTPQSTENPGTAPDTFREIKRIFESQYHILTLTGNGTATTTDTFIIGSSSTGILVTLPTASSVANGTTTKLFVIKNCGAGTITLSPTIDGVGSPTVSQNGTIVLFTNGTNWFEQRANLARTITGSIDIGTQTSGTLGLGTQTSGTLGLGTQTSGTLGLGTQTSGTLGLGTQTSGTLGLGTQTSGTLGLGTQTSGTISLGTQTSGVLAAISLGTQTNGQLNFDIQTGNFVKKWIVGSTSGTGSVELISGTGITIAGVDNGGAGSITITNNGVSQILAGNGISVSNNGTGSVILTAVGTASAGGWVDTGTQTIATAGYPVVPQGTLTIHATYGVSGLLDRDIPNTISLDNITQITTRNFSNMQGSVTDAQVPDTITLGTITQIASRNFSDIQGSVTTGQLPGITFDKLIGNATASGTFTTVPGANKIPVSSSAGKIDSQWINCNILQYKVYAYTGSATTTNAFSLNDTVPNNSQGIEVFTYNFTPASSTTRLAVDLIANLTSQNLAYAYPGIAVFKDSDYYCIGATYHGPANTGNTYLYFPTILGCDIASPGTSAITFKVRIGMCQWGASSAFVGINNTWDASAIASHFAGTSTASYLKITEYAP